MEKTRRQILNERARTLRANMTWYEKKLWFQFLAKYSLPFYPQKIIGNYILDFYCSTVRLCIEIDGDSHYGLHSEKYDDIRTVFLEMEEICVLRFTNIDIKESFEGVCEKIHQVVLERRNDIHSNGFARLKCKR